MSGGISQDEAIRDMQRSEITEHYIYKELANRAGKNKKVLEHIARHELKHYELLKKLSGREEKPDWLKIKFYSLIASLLGLSFGLKLMENGEENAQKKYSRLIESKKELKKIFKEEYKHEKELLELIEEERIKYASSIVLGLNDALVELSGAMAGLTFAMQDSKMVAATGLIVGIPAAMSMAASSYVSAKEDNGKIPIKSAVYTGLVYIATVLLLCSPYLLLENVYSALLLMFGLNIVVVAAYNFYIATAKGQAFWLRFGEMVGIMAVTAVVSFWVGSELREHIMQMPL
ncbi:MAG: VIT1/CCC1 family protein [Candidatus Anstonellales archaeon]